MTVFDNQFLREINFATSKSSKTAINAVLETLNFDFDKFQPSEITKFFKDAIFGATKTVENIIDKLTD